MPGMGQGNHKARTPRTIEGKVRTIADPGQQKSMQDYAAAVQLMQEGKYAKAGDAFRKIAQGGSLELADRARMYITACERHARENGRAFGSPEEQYDYAISLVNTGDYGEAREQLESILKATPNADYALYGLAILESMTGQADDCLEHLQRAIEINPRNRIQARTDSDFQDMADDPRFTELLYPEVS